MDRREVSRSFRDSFKDAGFLLPMKLWCLLYPCCARVSEGNANVHFLVQELSFVPAFVYENGLT